MTQPRDPQPACPHCGVTNGQITTSALGDQLLQSHAELCAHLRFIGRQMLRFERQTDGSLDRVRQALRRAENIRKALESSVVAPVMTNVNPDELLLTAPAPGSEISANQSGPEPSFRKTSPKRARLNKPRSLRLIKFPGA
jgi:hypothetical protein